MHFFLILFFLLQKGFSQEAERSNAGIYFRLNQKAVNYIANLTEEAMPQILEKMQFPTQQAGPAIISQLTIERFQRPIIEADFVENRGVSAQVILPLIKVSANAEVDIFLILSTNETFEIEFKNLTINMDVYFARDPIKNRNIIEIPNCNVTAFSFKGIFNQSLQLHLFQDMIKDMVTNMLQDKICQTTLDAIKYVDEQEIQPTPKTTPPPAENAAGGMASGFGSSLCAIDRIETDEDDEETPITTKAPLNSHPVTWGVDLTLNYPPKFSKDDVVFGVDGGVLLNEKSALDVEKPHQLNTSLLDEKMIGILLSDYIPNTLLSHLYDGGLGNYTERIYADRVPKFARGLAKLFCAKCFLEITANLTEKPRMQIDKRLGARLAISGNVSLTFQSSQKVHELLYADVTLHITLKPSIRHSRLYGDISLTNVDLNVKDIGMGGLLAFPLEKVANVIVPRALWPQVKKRLRFALNKRGVQLPIICGVEFVSMTLDYTNHAVVLNTDFTFDLPRFIRKFRLYLQEKGKQGLPVPQWKS